MLQGRFLNRPPPLLVPLSGHPARTLQSCAQAARADERRNQQPESPEIPWFRRSFLPSICELIRRLNAFARRTGYSRSVCIGRPRVSDGSTAASDGISGRCQRPKYHTLRLWDLDSRLT